MTYHGPDTYQVGKRIAWLRFHDDVIGIDGCLDEETAAEILAEWKRWKEEGEK